MVASPTKRRRTPPLATSQPLLSSWNEELATKQAGIIRRELVGAKKPPLPNMIAQRMHEVVIADTIGKGAKGKMTQNLKREINRVKIMLDTISKASSYSEMTIAVRAARFSERIEDRLLTLTENYFRKPGHERVLLTEDISHGLSFPPIHSYTFFRRGWHTHKRLDSPEVGDYLTENRFTADVNRDEHSDLTVSCQCQGGCGDDCPCEQLSRAKFTTIVNGKIGYLEGYNSFYGAVFACGPLCHSSPCCRDIRSLKHTGITTEVCERVPELHNGLRVLSNLYTGEVIMEFTGEVVSEDLMQDLARTDCRHERNSWSLAVRRDDNDRREFYEEIAAAVTSVQLQKRIRSYAKRARVAYLDPVGHGNEAMFINHGCYRNVAMVRVIANYLAVQRHHIFYVAARNILAGDELYIDYGDTYVLPFDCACCLFECRGEAARKQEKPHDTASRAMSWFIMTCMNELNRREIERRESQLDRIHGIMRQQGISLAARQGAKVHRGRAFKLGSPVELKSEISLYEKEEIQKLISSETVLSPLPEYRCEKPLSGPLNWEGPLPEEIRAGKRKGRPKKKDGTNNLKRKLEKPNDKDGTINGHKTSFISEHKTHRSSYSLSPRRTYSSSPEKNSEHMGRGRRGLIAKRAWSPSQ